MTDTAQPTRVEPTLGSAPARSDSPALSELRAAVEAAPADTAPRLDRAGLDQLSRIEEKTARIEEKYARTEALMGRLEAQVEQTTTRAGELARHADLVALRNEVAQLSQRTRSIPGAATLLVMAVLTALLTAGAILAAMKYGVPGVLPPAPPSAAQSPAGSPPR